MGTLILQDGTVLKGNSFGAIGGYEGEVIFDTAPVGYQETLSDLSYAKQIIVMTYPEIGNYGINSADFEADKSAVVGFVVKNYCREESHYKSNISLGEYLKQNDIIALEDIDTRSLTKKIRQIGAMSAFITSNDLGANEIAKKIEQLQSYKIPSNLINFVTTKEKYEYNQEGSIDVAFIDYGTKKGILKSLAQKNCKITVYPATTSAQEIINNKHDILFLSNGPGDPKEYTFQVEQVKELMGKMPIFGICLGYQIIALAAGADSYKMKYGHRGGNHPVINLENNKVMITSQNHGYAIVTENLPAIMRPTYKNLNDDTLEGFEINSLKIFAVQFHPEANPGPLEASMIFDEWINIAKKEKNNKINEVKNEK